MKILSDVNLNEISFSLDGRDLFFKFINMYDGSPGSIIKCRSVYVFNYSNTFEKDDGFACYIGEATCEKISYSDLKHWLEKKHFGFSGSDGSVYLPTKNDLLNLHIEGGEIVIDIACEIVEQDGNILKIT